MNGSPNSWIVIASKGWIATVSPIHAAQCPTPAAIAASTCTSTLRVLTGAIGKRSASQAIAGAANAHGHHTLTEKSTSRVNEWPCVIIATYRLAAVMSANPVQKRSATPRGLRMVSVSRRLGAPVARVQRNRGFVQRTGSCWLLVTCAAAFYQQPVTSNQQLSRERVRVPHRPPVHAVERDRHLRRGQLHDGEAALPLRVGGVEGGGVEGHGRDGIGAGAAHEHARAAGHELQVVIVPADVQIHLACPQHRQEARHPPVLRTREVAVRSEEHT